MPIRNLYTNLLLKNLKKRHRIFRENLICVLQVQKTFCQSSVIPYWIVYKQKLVDNKKESQRLFLTLRSVCHEETKGRPSNQ